jgi:putative acetyltransferase
MKITPVDFDNAAVQALLVCHVAEARRMSPPGTSFALDGLGLKAPEIAFFAAWREDELLGFGALKALSADHGEIKSMRTAPCAQRQGVASALLSRLIALAQDRGYRRVSLETGDGNDYAPARALYERFGFVEGEVFGDYPVTPFNRFFHRDL